MNFDFEDIHEMKRSEPFNILQNFTMIKSLVKNALFSSNYDFSSNTEKNV